jgi:hypothetical protein
MPQTQITAISTAPLLVPVLARLAIIATMPVIPAPTPALINIGRILRDDEDSAGEPESDRGEPSRASIRLSISAPIRSTKLSATAPSYWAPSS